MASVCSGLQLFMNDVVFAADLWNLVLDSTAKCHDWTMGPGTPSFCLAQLVLGSVFIEYLSHFSLIPSRLTNAISSVYERHLRKPQNGSFPNQYLQELAGETTASLSSAIYMSDSSSSNKEQVIVIVVPVGLPPELHQCDPEFFLVVDSGATVHCFWDATCTEHLIDQNSSIGWGGARSGLPCPVPTCGRRGRLAGAGSGLHSGVGFGRSMTGNSGGRKKGVV
jgi:hypothetical protein